MNNTATLNLLDLGGLNLWNSGDITGGTTNALNVTGSGLQLSGNPGPLGVNLNIVQDGANPGYVILSKMTNQLLLGGTSNYIDVQNGGSLDLYQNIAANGLQNTQGGIDFGPKHTGNPFAVYVEVGGTMARKDLPTSGVPDQITIGGSVYSAGSVQVLLGSMLKITGVDPFGYSYWQKSSANAVLMVDSGSNISAAGSYQINAGTVQLLTGGNSFDRLDGTGINFGNVANTNLTIVDGGTPGFISVQGPVTLAANSTTTMSFLGATNAPDQLIVQNGALTLNGTLNMHSIDGAKPNPSVALNFFQDTAAVASIIDSGLKFMDDVNGTDKGTVFKQNVNQWYYQVKIN
jgi:hypothetical protein